MKIEIIELEKGFAVKFPFELKDNFRQTFKSAKWNSYEKRWEVGPRSKKRLEQWVEIASPLADDIEKADEAELTEQEVIKLQEEIIEKRTEISRARASKETFLSTVEQLNKAKEELKKA